MEVYMEKVKRRGVYSSIGRGGGRGFYSDRGIVNEEEEASIVQYFVEEALEECKVLI